MAQFPKAMSHVFFDKKDQKLQGKTKIAQKPGDDFRESVEMNLCSRLRLTRKKNSVKKLKGAWSFSKTKTG
ncbi:MAG: hypothetical protein VX583_11405 [Bdellovibrionota bacterium]|nr:hypothetical protein [Pseudobdellovibrionaceae bacterium]